MIEIKDKRNCCGCSACVHKCPKQCILLKEDSEGFLYPEVEIERCIDCGLCEKVCPILNQGEARNPLKVYAAKNLDENIRKQSSSGGVFSLFAEKIIREGGIVFGARYDKNWQVRLDYTESIEGIAAFRGSKYVQARTEDAYRQAENFLKEGRKVLFTGTPCEIAGLHKFLRKEYDNLLTMDFLCHGVPSPKVWNSYLDELLACLGEKNSVSFSSKPLLFSERKCLIQSISFRDKKFGWKKFSFVLRHNLTKATAVGKANTVSFSQYHRVNTYMKGFLEDLYLRPSCHSCRFKRFQSGSDITIADYWGISRVKPEFEDFNGVSMAFINSFKAGNYFNSFDMDVIETKFEDTLSNKGLHENVPMHKKRDYFFKKLNSTASIINLIEKCVKPSFFDKVKNIIKRFLR